MKKSCSNCLNKNYKPKNKPCKGCFNYSDHKATGSIELSRQEVDSAIVDLAYRYLNIVMCRCGYPKVDGFRCKRCKRCDAE